MLVKIAGVGVGMLVGLSQWLLGWRSFEALTLLTGIYGALLLICGILRFLEINHAAEALTAMRPSDALMFTMAVWSSAIVVVLCQILTM